MQPYEAPVFGMGWVPDIPSVKDYTLETPDIQNLIDKNNEAVRRGGLRDTVSAGGGAAAAPAPGVLAAPGPRADLRPWYRQVEIEDQRDLGSCTAQAAVGLMEYFELRAHGRYLDASRLFVYKTSRNLLGWKGDTGAYIRTAMGALALFGAPPERYWPYDTKKFDEEPPVFCYAFASSYKAVQYYRLDTAGVTPTGLLEAVRKSIGAGFPLMFGFSVYDEFMRPVDGKVAFPARNSRLHGGHAVIACGYDDDMMIGADKGALLIRNSWGAGWGDKGYCWLSYRYVTEGLALDWWSLLRADWVDTGQFGLR